MRLASGALVVISGSGSWMSPVCVSGSLIVRERLPFWSIQPEYSNHLWLSGLSRRCDAGEKCILERMYRDVPRNVPREQNSLVLFFFFAVGDSVMDSDSIQRSILPNRLY